MSHFLRNLPLSFFRTVVSSRPIFDTTPTFFWNQAYTKNASIVKHFTESTSISSRDKNKKYGNIKKSALKRHKRCKIISNRKLNVETRNIPKTSQEEIIEISDNGKRHYIISRLDTDDKTFPKKSLQNKGTPFFTDVAKTSFYKSADFKIRSLASIDIVPQQDQIDSSTNSKNDIKIILEHPIALGPKIKKNVTKEHQHQIKKKKPSRGITITAKSHSHKQKTLSKPMKTDNDNLDYAKWLSKNGINEKSLVKIGESGIEATEEIEMVARKESLDNKDKSEVIVLEMKPKILPSNILTNTDGNETITTKSEDVTECGQNESNTNEVIVSKTCNEIEDNKQISLTNGNIIKITNDMSQINSLAPILEPALLGLSPDSSKISAENLEINADVPKKSTNQLRKNKSRNFDIFDQVKSTKTATDQNPSYQNLQSIRKNNCKKFEESFVNVNRKMNSFNVRKCYSTINTNDVHNKEIKYTLSDGCTKQRNIKLPKEAESKNYRKQISDGNMIIPKEFSVSIQQLSGNNQKNLAKPKSSEKKFKYIPKDVKVPPEVLAVNLKLAKYTLDSARKLAVSPKPVSLQKPKKLQCFQTIDDDNDLELINRKPCKMRTELIRTVLSKHNLLPVNEKKPKPLKPVRNVIDLARAGELALFKKQSDRIPEETLRQQVKMQAENSKILPKKAILGPLLKPGGSLGKIGSVAKFNTDSGNNKNELALDKFLEIPDPENHSDKGLRLAKDEAMNRLPNPAITVEEINHMIAKKSGRKNHSSIPYYKLLKKAEMIPKSGNSPRVMAKSIEPPIIEPKPEIVTMKRPENKMFINLLKKAKMISHKSIAVVDEQKKEAPCHINFDIKDFHENPINSFTERLQKESKLRIEYEPQFFRHKRTKKLPIRQKQSNTLQMVADKFILSNHQKTTNERQECTVKPLDCLITDGDPGIQPQKTGNKLSLHNDEAFITEDVKKLTSSTTRQMNKQLLLEIKPKLEKTEGLVKKINNNSNESKDKPESPLWGLLSEMNKKEDAKLNNINQEQQKPSDYKYKLLVPIEKTMNISESSMTPLFKCFKECSHQFEPLIDI